MQAAGRASETPDPTPPGERILVLFEPGRAGIAAVELARELAAETDATVTVVSVAPQAPMAWGCVPSARDYNATVRDSAAQELEAAGRLLWDLGPRARSRVLLEGTDPTFEELAARERFDLILLPRRRRLLRGAGHPAASRLSACGPARVRIVDRGG